MTDSTSSVFDIQHPDSDSALLLTVDHASRHIPEEYNNLGLTDPSVLARHIAWDIGIEDVTRRLSDRLKATAIYARFSRLLLDANRYPHDPASTPVISDGVEIPANQDMTEAEKARRVETYFTPYQGAITDLIERKREAHEVPLLISMHSFTPVMNDFERPWHIGVLWDRDPRIALPLLKILRENSSLVVGDNEPYSAREPLGYTMNEHGMKRGIPNVAIEIRQDLIDTHQGAEKWASIMADALTRLGPLAPYEPGEQG
ncbi:N-formylglutamate amidohydrolase [Sneathiella sp. CAU 1612]|uniref:N-formylglutamate amidohydrolase n=1 Tax=Sneathiella sedimenti TaxID=2816034 RepID=A0ABS3F4U5_9PROT|nr:N-formylglutamate amidohydrolase [Sneathiella sedimenti]MBO0333544.1 N-formylglutamate amidohydrolase [Sneathiella sedimenti]